MTVSKFYCFYSSTPLWVDAKPDFSVLESGGKTIADLMTEVVCRFDEEHYSIRLCRDGLCMVSIDSLDIKFQEIERQENQPAKSSAKRKELIGSWLSVYSQYAHHLNALQLLFDSALLGSYSIAFQNTALLRSSDIFPVIFDETKLHPLIDYDSTESFHAKRNMLRKCSRLESYDQSIPLEQDRRIIQRMVVPEAVFDLAVGWFDHVYDDPDKINVLSHIISALDSYNQSDYPMSLVQSWFMIEQFLNRCWKTFLEEKSAEFAKANKGTRLNSDRRKILNGKDFTASIKSNVLELVGNIPFDIFTKIDSVRNKRNKVAHFLDEVLREEKQSKTVTVEDCKMAMEVLDHFVNQEYGILLGFTNAIF